MAIFLILSTSRRSHNEYERYYKTMSDFKLKNPVVTNGYIQAPYKYSMGVLASEFFVKLRDSKQITAAKCPACGSITVPPRSACPKCFAKITDLVELSGKGTLVTYTVVHYASSVQAAEPPYAVGVIKLEGADKAITHLLGEVDFKKLKKGMKLKPVFKNKRSGCMLDIEYFKPAGK
ncbi:MAG: Zn-ribbon domain-containing OB-fold protein [Dehalococcoidia bacterium]|nr:Zn-ribbon domain-containing OB-fold protein [Dehalococcoidia bacterium]